MTPSHVSSLQRIFDDGRGGEREEGEGWWKCRYWEMHFREELSGVGTLERYSFHFLFFSLSLSSLIFLSLLEGKN